MFFTFSQKGYLVEWVWQIFNRGFLVAGCKVQAGYTVAGCKVAGYIYVAGCKVAGCKVAYADGCPRMPYRRGKNPSVGGLGCGGGASASAGTASRWP